MVKAFRTIFIVSVLSFTVLVACNNSDSYKKKISALETENEGLKKQIEEFKKTMLREKETASPIPSLSDKKAENIKKTIEENKAITVVDVGEFTLKKAVFAKEVAPPKATGNTIKFENKESIIYLDTIINLKNLLPNSMFVGRIVDVKVKYDGKYNYNSFGLVETFKGANFGFASESVIDPLHTEIVHFVTELPEEASTDGKSIQISVLCNEEEYIYNLR
ncbi:hypothetical protein GK047_01225 [Paenibacillus sp. SYP-B3998]|uniref:DUF881 domain-containing protein n=1 Tax=Paenibacillus sp. SYP-B3998 TaxID=2678564 RepID=A0A6G3ZR13_9BACL|nr:hypothetical protein [Paenibacillus sp. SYP-B3998]NEW04646.1 hypothetical protein [Paenibacillus sp. SYP-B3998]